MVDAEDAVRGQHTVPRSRRKAILECAGIAAHRFRGRFADAVGEEVSLNETVLRGDDVLDLGAVVRLLQREGIDQDVASSLIG